MLYKSLLCIILKWWRKMVDLYSNRQIKFLYQGKIENIHNCINSADGGGRIRTQADLLLAGNTPYHKSMAGTQ